MECLLCVLVQKGVIDIPTCLCIFAFNRCGPSVEDRIKREVNKQLEKAGVKPEARVMDPVSTEPLNNQWGYESSSQLKTMALLGWSINDDPRHLLTNRIMDCRLKI